VLIAYATGLSPGKLRRQSSFSGCSAGLLALREEPGVGLAEVLTNYEGSGSREGLGLILRSKMATLLTQVSRVLSESIEGLLAVQGAGLAKFRLGALGKCLSLRWACSYRPCHAAQKASV
jgi:hypothetical protein